MILDLESYLACLVILINFDLWLVFIDCWLMFIENISIELGVDYASLMCQFDGCEIGCFSLHFLSH